MCCQNMCEGGGTRRNAVTSFDDGLHGGATVFRSDSVVVRPPSVAKLTGLGRDWLSADRHASMRLPDANDDHQWIHGYAKNGHGKGPSGWAPSHIGYVILALVNLLPADSFLDLPEGMKLLSSHIRSGPAALSGACLGCFFEQRSRFGVFWSSARWARRCVEASRVRRVTALGPCQWSKVCRVWDPMRWGRALRNSVGGFLCGPGTLSRFLICRRAPSDN